MTRLTDEQADELYRDYVTWLDAVAKYHPKRLQAKYGIPHNTFYRYARKQHKRRQTRGSASVGSLSLSLHKRPEGLQARRRFL